MSPLEIANIIGTISFALSGFLIAVHYRLDILGITISAFLTAIGGGIVRDTMAHNSLYIFQNSLPSLLIIGTILFSLIFKLHKKDNVESKTIFIVSDAIGLSSFAITGALIGVQADFNFFGVLLLAFITAVGGGTIRDILINKVPFILVSEFYGTVALIVGGLVYLLNFTNLMNLASLTLLFIFGVTLRLIAYYKKWNLPTLNSNK